MREFYLIGSGTLANLILETAEAMTPAPKCVGILDDYRNKGDLFQGIEVIGGLNELEAMRSGSTFVIGIGDPKVRAKLSERLDELAHDQLTLIHPAALVSSSAEVGEGSLIAPMTSVLAGSVIGKSVCILAATNINQDVRIGDFALIGASVVIGNNASIGCGAHLGLGTQIPLNGQISDWADV